MRYLLAGFLTVAACLPALAEQPGAFVLGGEQRRLYLHDPSCSADVAHECVTATLACDTQPFELVVYGFSSAAAGAWLARTDGNAALRIDRRVVGLPVLAVEYGDANGDWSVRASQFSDPASVWSALAADPSEVRVDTPSGAVDLLPRDRSLLTRVAVACGGLPKAPVSLSNDDEPILLTPAIGDE